MLRIGIDIGGTFTDFVIFDPANGSISSFKLLSDNKNPASTVLQGLNVILADQPAQIIHGSTVATNALLERKGAKTALVTTNGFKDVIQIGRQNRLNLYDLSPKAPPVLVPSELRFEIVERIDSHGKTITPLNMDGFDELLTALSSHNTESIAVCFLFSFLNPAHEQIVTHHLRDHGFFVSASSEILPEYREFERTSTTVVNAYVSPILDRYLKVLETSFPDSNLQMMQSNGGMINLNDARKNGARCILSGPAGGIVGAQNIAQHVKALYPGKKLEEKVKIITFDMGGTSTDVSLISGEPTITTEAIIGGYPIHLPLLDIHTIGAGGGSIASMDPGGALRVGPESSGADPGPACYGKGTLPTVTDANLVLGRLLPDYFLGGQMPIYPERAYAALKYLGATLNLDPVEAAFGVIDVVNTQMARALRVISVERGYDPREFSLFTFGGAGGLHASDLARDLGIPKIIISKFASTLSAYGMLVSNVMKDYVQTVMVHGNIKQENLDKLFAPLVKRALKDLINQGVAKKDIDIIRTLDMRFSGQSYELFIPYTTNFIDLFRKFHAITYGYSYNDKEIEIVNIRVKAVGKAVPINLPTYNGHQTKDKFPIPEFVQVKTREGGESIAKYKYDQLYPGLELDGPALIVSPDTTILINPGDRLIVDNFLNLLIDVNGSHI